MKIIFKAKIYTLLSAFSFRFNSCGLLIIFLSLNDPQIKGDTKQAAIVNNTNAQRYIKHANP